MRGRALAVIDAAVDTLRTPVARVLRAVVVCGEVVVVVLVATAVAVLEDDAVDSFDAVDPCPTVSVTALGETVSVVDLLLTEECCWLRDCRTMLANFFKVGKTPSPDRATASTWGKLPGFNSCSSSSTE